MVRPQVADWGDGLQISYGKVQSEEIKGRKEQYHVEFSNTFAALLNLDAEVDINRVWDTFRDNRNISAKESLEYYEL
jgi:hypothetical protein